MKNLGLFLITILFPFFTSAAKLPCGFELRQILNDGDYTEEPKIAGDFQIRLEHGISRDQVLEVFLTWARETIEKRPSGYILETLKDANKFEMSLSHEAQSWKSEGRWEVRVSLVKSADQIFEIQLETVFWRDSSIKPTLYRTSFPGFLRRLASSKQPWGLYSRETRLTDIPFLLSHGNAAFDFKRAFTDKNRRFAVVYISTNERNEYGVDIQRLAENLAGIAMVVVEPFREFPIQDNDLRALATQLPFNGFIDVYGNDISQPISRYRLPSNSEEQTKLMKSISTSVLMYITDKN